MEYIIGAGAILETGDAGTITAATLHANVASALAQRVRAAAIDFEATSVDAIARLLIVGPGWNAGRFRQAVTEPLCSRRTCSLADVLRTLAMQIQSQEVHVFAHWLPDEATCAELADAGITLVAHPLETIESAALVAGQRYTRWNAVRAA